MEKEVIDKTRDFRFDFLKGILIFLVVLGHLIGEYKDNEVISLVWRCIYLFHMPAFAFVSGYFFNQKDEKSFKRDLVPLFLFQILYEVFHVMYYRRISGYALHLTPYWTLWYLLSLFFWKGIYKAVQCCRFVFIISVLFGVIAGFSSEIGYALSASRTVVFFPFFIMGAEFRKRNFIKQSYSMEEKVIALSVAAVGLFCFAKYLNFIPDKILNGSYSYERMGVKNFYGGGIQMCSLLFIIAIVSFIYCSASFCGKCVVKTNLIFWKKFNYYIPFAWIFCTPYRTASYLEMFKNYRWRNYFACKHWYNHDNLFYNQFLLRCQRL